MSEAPTTSDGDGAATWKVRDLILRDYGDTVNDQQIRCEPTTDDIRNAISSGDLEERNYQQDLESLKNEWLQACQNSANPLGEWKRIVTRYHANRIAYFVENGWTHPISIRSNGEVTDGTHRAKAAIYMGLETVAVKIEE